MAGFSSACKGNGAPFFLLQEWSWHYLWAFCVFPLSIKENLQSATNCSQVFWLSALTLNSQTALSTSSTIENSAQLRSSKSLVWSIFSFHLLDKPSNSLLGRRKSKFSAEFYWFNHKTFAQLIWVLGKRNCQKWDNLLNNTPMLPC